MSCNYQRINETEIDSSNETQRVSDLIPVMGEYSSWLPMEGSKAKWVEITANCTRRRRRSRGRGGATMTEKSKKRKEDRKKLPLIKVTSCHAYLAWQKGSVLITVLQSVSKRSTALLAHETVNRKVNFSGATLLKMDLSELLLDPHQSFS